MHSKVGEATATSLSRHLQAAPGWPLSNVRSMPYATHPSRLRRGHQPKIKQPKTACLFKIDHFSVSLSPAAWPLGIARCTQLPKE